MQRQPSLSFLLRLLAVVLAFAGGGSSASDKKTRSLDRTITIFNSCMNRVEILWIHPTTGEESQITAGIIPGTEFALNSFVAHKFVARERPGKDGKCKNEKNVCRHLFFEVSESDDQMFRITEEFEMDVIDTKIKAEQEAADIVSRCKAASKDLLDEAGDDKMALMVAMDEMTKCVEGRVTSSLEKINDEVAFQANVRRDIAAKLENYTCIDDTLNSTEDIDSDNWTSRRDGVKRKVHIKHERPASKIHVIENFIDKEECEAMEEAAKSSLHRATVADGKGGSQLSEHRKAMQAGINVDWTKEKDGDPIARLSRRVYDYTNHVLGLDIEENGQEDLMSIQYFGRGADDATPDRYMPHCDGDCTGLKHKYGSRMATVVMYCTVADRGGHTNFRNAGVHVKPERGNAIFFSYIDPETLTMDSGFTEHSGCPVFEGSKKIVTQWVRYGVDDDNPWDSFNTLGISNKELEHLDLDDDEERSGYDEASRHLPVEAVEDPEDSEDDSEDDSDSEDDDEDFDDEEFDSQDMEDEDDDEDEDYDSEDFDDEDDIDDDDFDPNDFFDGDEDETKEE